MPADNVFSLYDASSQEDPESPDSDTEPPSIAAGPAPFSPNFYGLTAGTPRRVLPALRRPLHLKHVARDPQSLTVPLSPAKYNRPRAAGPRQSPSLPPLHFPSPPLAPRPRMHRTPRFTDHDDGDLWEQL